MQYTIRNLQNLFASKKNSKFTIEEIKNIFNLHTEEAIETLLDDIKALEEEGNIIELNGKYTNFPKNGNYILQRIKVDEMGYFYLNNVNATDMKLNTLFPEDILSVGTNIKVTAIIENYNSTTTLLSLKIIKIEVR